MAGGRSEEHSILISNLLKEVSIGSEEEGRAKLELGIQSRSLIQALEESRTGLVASVRKIQSEVYKEIMSSWISELSRLEPRITNYLDSKERRITAEEDRAKQHYFSLTRSTNPADPDSYDRQPKKNDRKSLQELQHAADNLDKLWTAKDAIKDHNEKIKTAINNILNPENVQGSGFMFFMAEQISVVNKAISAFNIDHPDRPTETGYIKPEFLYCNIYKDLDGLELKILANDYDDVGIVEKILSQNTETTESRVSLTDTQKMVLGSIKASLDGLRETLRPEGVLTEWIKQLDQKKVATYILDAQKSILQRERDYLNAGKDYRDIIKVMSTLDDGRENKVFLFQTCWDLPGRTLPPVSKLAAYLDQKYPQIKNITINGVAQSKGSPSDLDILIQHSGDKFETVTIGTEDIHSIESSQEFDLSMISRAEMEKYGFAQNTVFKHQYDFFSNHMKSVSEPVEKDLSFSSFSRLLQDNDPRYYSYSESWEKIKIARVMMQSINKDRLEDCKQQIDESKDLLIKLEKKNYPDELKRYLGSLTESMIKDFETTTKGYFEYDVQSMIVEFNNELYEKYVNREITIAQAKSMYEGYKSELEIAANDRRSERFSKISALLDKLSYVNREYNTLAIRSQTTEVRNIVSSLKLFIEGFATDSRASPKIKKDMSALHQELDSVNNYNELEHIIQKFDDRIKSRSLLYRILDFIFRRKDFKKIINKTWSESIDKIFSDDNDSKKSEGSIKDEVINRIRRKYKRAAKEELTNLLGKIEEAHKETLSNEQQLTASYSRVDDKSPEYLMLKEIQDRISKSKQQIDQLIYAIRINPESEGIQLSAGLQDYYNKIVSKQAIDGTKVYDIGRLTVDRLQIGSLHFEALSDGRYIKEVQEKLQVEEKQLKDATVKIKSSLLAEVVNCEHILETLTESVSVPVSSLRSSVAACRNAITRDFPSDISGKSLSYYRSEMKAISAMNIGLMNELARISASLLPKAALEQTDVIESGDVEATSEDDDVASTTYLHEGSDGRSSPEPAFASLPTKFDSIEYRKQQVEEDLAQLNEDRKQQLLDWFTDLARNPYFVQQLQTKQSSPEFGFVVKFFAELKKEQADLGLDHTMPSFVELNQIFDKVEKIIANPTQGLLTRLLALLGFTDKKHEELDSALQALKSQDLVRQNQEQLLITHIATIESNDQVMHPAPFILSSSFPSALASSNPVGELLQAETAKREEISIEEQRALTTLSEEERKSFFKTNQVAVKEFLPKVWPQCIEKIAPMIQALEKFKALRSAQQEQNKALEQSKNAGKTVSQSYEQIGTQARLIAADLAKVNIFLPLLKQLPVEHSKLTTQDISAFRDVLGYCLEQRFLQDQLSDAASVGSGSRTAKIVDATKIFDLEKVLTTFMDQHHKYFKMIDSKTPIEQQYIDLQEDYTTAPELKRTEQKQSALPKSQL